MKRATWKFKKRFSGYVTLFHFAPDIIVSSLMSCLIITVGGGVPASLGAAGKCDGAVRKGLPVGRLLKVALPSSLNSIELFIVLLWRTWKRRDWVFVSYVILVKYGHVDDILLCFVNCLKNSPSRMNYGINTLNGLGMGLQRVLLL